MNHKFKNSAGGPELVLTPQDALETTILTDMVYDQRRGRSKSGNIEVVAVMDGNVVKSISIREKAFITHETIKSLFQQSRAYSWGILGYTISGEKTVSEKTIIIVGCGTFKCFVYDGIINFKALNENDYQFNYPENRLFDENELDNFNYTLSNPVLVNTISDLTLFLSKI